MSKDPLAPRQLSSWPPGLGWSWSIPMPFPVPVGPGLRQIPVSPASQSRSRPHPRPADPDRLQVPPGRGQSRPSRSPCRAFTKGAAGARVSPDGSRGLPSRRRLCKEPSRQPGREWPRPGAWGALREGPSQQPGREQIVPIRLSRESSCSVVRVLISLGPLQSNVRHDCWSCLGFVWPSQFWVNRSQLEILLSLLETRFI